MNLSEEKKTPLRDKDLNTKREMVIQYIGTASKAVSLKKIFIEVLLEYNLAILVRAVSMRK